MIPKECKRLAEVDFPIAEVSRHAAHDKSIRQGHPSNLHLWWARRPLASSRAVLLGSHTDLYASKQQKGVHKPDPRDDVFARGVLWYQLLIGDLTSERPGGNWHKKVRDLGLSEGLLDLLGGCVDDDPAERPANAAELAEQLAVIPLLRAAAQAELDRRAVSGSRRTVPPTMSRAEFLRRMDEICGPSGEGTAATLPCEEVSDAERR